jgi:hypothetical protein
LKRVEGFIDYRLLKIHGLSRSFVSVHGLVGLMEIPNNKSQKYKQITITEIQNSKPYDL